VHAYAARGTRCLQPSPPVGMDPSKKEREGSSAVAIGCVVCSQRKYDFVVSFCLIARHQRNI
jgi:hypothetical protein